ncbi:MAG: hypothetical protein HYU66_05790 [Armatimonadetes bacterium]|nr:hypothetical protein [Armatimonadota bacterium]
MSIHVELTPQEEARLRAAAERQGIAAEECARRLITEHLSGELTEEARLTRELFARWEAEDATDDPEELAARERELAEFMANMNANRLAVGARILYQ